MCLSEDTGILHRLLCRTPSYHVSTSEFNSLIVTIEKAESVKGRYWKYLAILKHF